MTKTLTISSEDILRQIKLTCQIPSFVEAVAREKVITETALEVGITISEEELQQEGDKLRFAKQLVKAKDTWEWLKKHELNLNDFEELVRFNILSQKLANHLFADKVDKFFYEQQLNYLAAATYEVRLDDRDLALELFYGVKEGETTFQEIARQYIEEPELRRAGGYQGLRHRKDFRPEIATAVFAATPPEILKPITTPKGVYLIWVEEIIQPELNEELRGMIQQELFSYWLKQEIQAISILTQLDSFTLCQTLEEMKKQA